MKTLVVKSAFGGYERGSKITDAAEIEEILAGENCQHVVVSDHAPDASADAPKKKSAD